MRHGNKTKKPRELTPELCAPYRFVPLNTDVFVPDWADYTSHDVPLRDGLCGHIDLELEAMTEIFTRGEEPSGKDRTTPLEFMRRDGTPIIKASTLRGAFRQVLAIVSGGKFGGTSAAGGMVDDRRFGVRDITSTSSPYAEFIGVGTASKNVHAGWLCMEEDRDEHTRTYHIVPQRLARVHRSDLEKIQAQRGNPGWRFESVLATPKYDRWKGTLEITADIEPHKNNVMAVNLGAGSKRGTLVFTGVVPVRNERAKKKRDFFFYNDSNLPSRIDVSQELFTHFVQAHSGTQQRSDIGLNGQTPNDTWKFWEEKLMKSERVPVFYSKDRSSGELRAIGLAYLPRIASFLSVHEAVSNASSKHLDDAIIDLPELLFGRLPSQDLKQRGRRARVSFEDAKLVSEERVCSPVTMILSSPRASWATAYLAQGSSGAGTITNWLEESGKVAGWKRYPVVGQADRVPKVARDPKTGKLNDRMNTTIKPLAAGSRFVTRLHFHNVRPQELGALLWVFDFGKHIADGRHKIGMAKPYGYGEVKVKTTEAHLIINDPHAEEVSLDDCVSAFEEMMFGWDAEWLSSVTIASLLALSTPKTWRDPTERAKLRYYEEPKEFAQATRDHHVFGDIPGLKELRADLRTQEQELRLERARREQERLANLTPEERAHELVSNMREGEALDYIRDHKDDRDAEVEAMFAAIDHRFGDAWQAYETQTNLSKGKLHDDYLFVIAPHRKASGDSAPSDFACSDVPELVALIEAPAEDQKLLIKKLAERVDELDWRDECLRELLSQMQEYFRQRGRKSRDKKLIKNAIKKLQKRTKST